MIIYVLETLVLNVYESNVNSVCLSAILLKKKKKKNSINSFKQTLLT